MEEKNSSNKLTIVAFLSIVALAFLVVFTNSKFQEAVGIASDSGRVAFFIGDGSINYPLQGMELAPGETSPNKFEFSVSNKVGNQVTEVATRYTISIDNGNVENPLGTLPLTYTLYEDGKDQGTVLSVENFYTSEIIPPGSVTPVKREYQLEIAWPDTSGNRDIIYDNQLKVPRLTFEIVQVD